MLKDGTWRPWQSASLKGGTYDSAHDPVEDVHFEQHPYHYMLPDGTVQTVQARVLVERWEHRIFMLRWLGWPRRRYQSIDVHLSGEAGTTSNASGSSGPPAACASSKGPDRSAAN